MNLLLAGVISWGFSRSCRTWWIGCYSCSTHCCVTLVSHITYHI